MFSFPKARRWEYIEDVSRRTSSEVGPGAYNVPISTNKGKGYLMRPESIISTNQNKDTEYICVENIIVKREKPQTRAKSLQKTRNQDSNSLDNSPREKNTKDREENLAIERARFRVRSNFGRRRTTNNALTESQQLESSFKSRNHSSYK